MVAEERLSLFLPASLREGAGVLNLALDNKIGFDHTLRDDVG
jgi:hypothetical protein